MKHWKCFQTSPNTEIIFDFFLNLRHMASNFLGFIKKTVKQLAMGGKPRSFRRFSTSPVFPELDPSHVLLVDEVGGHRVLGGVVPRGEDLLPGKIN